MSKMEDHRDRWMRDIQSRQRNIVFPDTTQNEARFWRNLGNPAFNTPAKIGLGVFAAWVLGILIVVVAELRLDNSWAQHLASVVLGLLFVFGPIFGAIAWATNRALRRVGITRKRR
jgi:hypothetical protein